MLAKDLEVFELPLKHLNIYYVYDKLTLREMVMHMKAVNDADLQYPIIRDICPSSGLQNFSMFITPLTSRIVTANECGHSLNL